MGMKLTGITGKRGNWLHKPGVPYHVHERRARDGNPECLFGWCLPLCMGDEGSEALEAVDMEYKMNT